MNIVHNLFDSEDSKNKIVFKAIKAVYEQQVVCENAPEYLAGERFFSPRQVFEIFRDLHLETKEHFICLHLDGRNRILCIDRVSVGNLNQSIVHPREVLKTALLSSASALVLLHNHPSGDSNPSREDIEVTRRLKDACELLGIVLLDHIIIGDGYMSFKEAGRL